MYVPVLFEHYEELKKIKRDFETMVSDTLFKFKVLQSANKSNIAQEEHSN